MLISIKKLSFDSWNADNFHRWTPIIMFAKILTSMKFIVLANRSAKLPYAWIKEILDEITEEGDIIFENYRITFEHLPVN
jgi:hypothetical protein